MANFDAIIIGAGHNGLVTAAYLAKAGKKILVLERRQIVGGIAATEEVFPGFKFSTCAHLAGSFSKEIIAELELRQHGLEILPLNPLVFAPSLDGNALVIPSDLAKAPDEIAHHSKADADRFQSFCARTRSLSTFLRALYDVPLPDQSDNGNFNAAEYVKIAWKFHRLGEKEMYEFLRVLPMSLADLLNEWFENDLLKATLAAGGVFGSFVGPRQQGTAFSLLHHRMGESNGALRTAGFVRCGIGQITQALASAASRSGAEIRTGAEVLRIVTKNHAATGVVLSNGDEINANKVISSADTKRTFLKLVEPTYLDPQFLLQVRNIRARGTVAKINLALDSLPRFKSFEGYQSNLLGGVIHIGPALDYLERACDDAKYGRLSQKPFLEITIPSVADPSLAPAGKHVMSIWTQSAPYHLRESNWHELREGLGDAVVNLLEEHAPGFESSVLYRQVLTPLDLEQTYGLTEGHLDHAEMALDQLFFMRPVPGLSRYHTPIRNLYLCGSGAHPGGGITGLPGHFAAKEILKSWSRRT